MYAVFVEVNAGESHIEDARKFLNEVMVPRAKDHGARGGFWLAAQNGRGASMVVFDTEDEARKVAGTLKVGEPAGPHPDVTFKTVEVREVIASI